MTTLAEVNATLGVTNIALSSVAKEQKETNQGISKFVDFMQDKDTRDRREDIETNREKKASVISRVGGAASAAGGAVAGIGKKGLDLGKGLFGGLGNILPVGLAGAFLTSLIGSKLFRGGIAGLGFIFGDQIAEFLTGPDAKREVKDMVSGAVKGGALGFLLGPRFGLIGAALGALLSNKEIDEQAGRLLTNLKDLKVKFPALGKFFTGLTGAIGSGLKSINNLLEGNSENKVADIAKSIALIGGVAALFMPGKLFALLAGATKLLMRTPAGLALLAIGGGGLLANKLMGNEITEGEVDPIATGTGALVTAGGLYAGKKGLDKLRNKTPVVNTQQTDVDGKPSKGSRFDRQMNVALKGLRQYPRLLSFVKAVGRTGPLAALFGIGQIIQMASTGTLNPESLGKVFGGLIGGVGGTKLGAAIGSIFPGPGTLIGGLLGGGLGFFAGEYVAGKLANFLLGKDDGEFKKAGNPRAARAQQNAKIRGEKLAETFKGDPTSGVRTSMEYSGDPTGNAGDMSKSSGAVNVVNSNNRTINNNSSTGIAINNSGAIDRNDLSLGNQIRLAGATGLF